MNQKEILNLAIRILGLIFLYHGLRAVPEAVNLLLEESFPFKSFLGSQGSVEYRRTFEFFTVLKICVGVVWPFLIAAWLVRGGPPVMSIAYPDESKSDEHDA